MNLTGKPSVDKPWLQFYPEQLRNVEVPKMTIEEFLKFKNLYSQPEDAGQARGFVPDQGKFLQAGCRPARKFNVERGQKARLDGVLRL